MHRTQLLLPDDVYERLRLIAFQSRRSLAEVIREAIQRYLAVKTEEDDER